MRRLFYVFLHLSLRTPLFMFLLWPGGSNAQAEQHISVLPLNNSTAEELIPVIQSQLSEGSSVSSYQNQIILNATDEETANIKTLLDTLDHASKQLMISVKSDNSNSLQANGGSIKQGSNSQLSANLQMRTTNNIGNDQQGMRISEGYPGYITMGSSRSYNQPLINSNGNIIQNQQWQNAASGFYATCWVNGNEVSIKIEQQKQGFISNTSMQNQQLQTRVSGKLGEWIAIGNLNSQNNNRSNSVNSINNSKNIQSNIIYLKVELAE